MKNFMEAVVEQLNNVSYQDLELEKQGWFSEDQFVEHKKRLTRKQTEYINDLANEFKYSWKKPDGYTVYSFACDDLNNVSDNYYDYGYTDGADDHEFYNLSKEQCETLCSFAGIKFYKNVQVVVEYCEYPGETIDVRIRVKSNSKRHPDWHKTDVYYLHAKILNPIFEYKVKCEPINNDRMTDSFKSELPENKNIVLTSGAGFKNYYLNEDEEFDLEKGCREIHNKNLRDFLDNNFLHGPFGDECFVYDKRSNILTRWLVETKVVGYKGGE